MGAYYLRRLTSSPMSEEEQPALVQLLVASSVSRPARSVRGLSAAELLFPDFVTFVSFVQAGLEGSRVALDQIAIHQWSPNDPSISFSFEL